MLISAGSYLKIEGFHFRSSGSTNADLVIFYKNSYALTITDCYFEQINVNVSNVDGSGGTEYINCSFFRSSFIAIYNGVNNFLNAFITESYVEGMLQITDSILKDSSVELNYWGGISGSTFSGSLRIDDYYRPQVSVNNFKYTFHYHGKLSIADCNFTEALNGVIEINSEALDYYRTTLIIQNSNFTNNKANKNTGIIDIKPAISDIKLSDCRFDENDAIIIKILNLDSILLNGITIRNSRYKSENFNPILISNSPKLAFKGNCDLQCPINTIVEFENKTNNFDYYCIPIDGNKYSTIPAKLTMIDGSSFSKTIPPVFQCPDVAVCSARGIQSKGDHWGHVVNSSSGEIHFLLCPAFHCCRSIKDCESYDTCRNKRTGKLCGSCPDGFTISMFNQYGCIRVGDCDDAIVWLIILLSGAFITVLFTYSEKMFRIFDFLETTKKPNKKNTTVNQQTSQHHDNKPQILGARDKDIDKLENMADQEIATTGEPNDSAITHDSVEIKNHQIIEGIENQSLADSNETSCQVYPNELAYITNEKPPTDGNLHSAQGMIKTLLFFYQAVGLLLLNNSVISPSLLPTEIISSVASIKLQAPSMEYDACPFATHNIFIIEIMKISIFFASLVVIFTLITCLSIYKVIRANQDKHNRNDYEIIDEKVDEFEKPSISLRLKSAYVQILCYGYTAVTVLILHNIHHVTIADDCVMFLDASVKCSTRESTILVCALFLLFWCVMFIFALFVGCRWLSHCTITLNQFLILLTVPPLIIVFWIRIRATFIKRKLNYNKARSAKHLLRIISGPYRLKEGTSRDEPQTRIVWDCIYLSRCFVMSLVCVLPNESLDRLLLVCAVLLFFLVLHLHARPFEMARMYQIESCSSVSLLLMAFSCFIMNSHVESAIILKATDVFIAMSFTPVIAYALFLLHDVILVYVVDYIEKTINKRLFN